MLIEYLLSSGQKQIAVHATLQTDFSLAQKHKRQTLKIEKARSHRFNIFVSVEVLVKCSLMTDHTNKNLMLEPLKGYSFDTQLNIKAYRVYLPSSRVIIKLLAVVTKDDEQPQIKEEEQSCDL